RVREVPIASGWPGQLLAGMACSARTAEQQRIATQTAVERITLTPAKRLPTMMHRLHFHNQSRRSDAPAERHLNGRLYLPFLIRVPRQSQRPGRSAPREPHDSDCRADIAKMPATWQRSRAANRAAG